MRGRWIEGERKSQDLDEEIVGKVLPAGWTTSAKEQSEGEGLVGGAALQRHRSLL
jgi:hypothetical protein